MENSKKYLEKCAYFEVSDDTAGITNYYMRINKRWLRGDDGLSFSHEGIEQFVEQLLHVARPMTLTFYGVGIERVRVGVNG